MPVSETGIHETSGGELYFNTPIESRFMVWQTAVTSGTPWTGTSFSAL